MSTRTILLLVLALSGAVAWGLRDSQWLRQALAPSAGVVRGGADAAPTGLHKCRRGNEVLYTDGACPSGSRAEAVSGGAVTVLPAPARPAASVPNARDLLAPRGGPDLREKQIDEVIGK